MDENGKRRLVCFQHTTALHCCRNRFHYSYTHYTKIGTAYNVHACCAKLLEQCVETTCYNRSMSTTYALRPYQKEAVLEVFHQWRDGSQKTLLVLPTGTGKTIAFANIAKICVEHKQRVLILAHRGELLEQAQDKIKQATGLDSAIEKAEQTAVNDDAPIVIASMQTLAQEHRLHAYSKNAFQVIILDEAHHALSKSYQKIFSYFDKAFLLGVTATAERGDKQELSQFFTSQAYEYSLLQAVNDGFLVPMKAMTIPLKLDIRSVKMQNGDFQAGALGNALEPYLEQIASEMEKVCRNRKTIVFLPLIRISQKFQSILNTHGFSAAEVNGNSTDRKQIIQDFTKGKYNVICNSMLLTEGFDCPSIDCVIILRPTKVAGLYKQMIGRGTRLFPGKEELLILDFLLLTEKYDLCRPASLVTDKVDEQVRITWKLEKGELLDLQQTEEEVKKDILAERKKALAKALKEQKDKQRKILNPLEVGVMLNDTQITDYEPTFHYETTKASEKQLAALEKFGMDPSTIQTRGQASLLLQKLIARSHNGLSTLKQIRFLDSRNFQNVYRWKFEEASEMMDCIAKNHWNIPANIDPITYVPHSLQPKRKKKKAL